MARPHCGQWISVGCACVLVCAFATAQSAKTPTTTAKKSSTHTTSHKGKKSKKKTASRGQKKIDSDRTRTIQEALIRENYMKGSASGVWDDASQKAMERYQADNGWQSKTVPDSRALIKLGLGPDDEHLLNPETAMTSGPATIKDTSTSKDPPQK